MNTTTTSQISAQSVPSEPAILSANTYFWTSASSAGSRRRNEERHQASVASYFEALGFAVNRSNDCVIADMGDLHVCFDYSESCHNVYKHLSVTRAGKNSNITAIRKVVASLNLSSLPVAA